jgi:chemotaxis response regulator CheB
VSNDATFPIVGIGASAGGVQALEGFFRGLPPQPGIGLVVVTHLSPTRESRLPEVLTGFTTLPVHIAQHGMEVLPNTVYVIPANAVLGIENGRLQVRKQNAGLRERKPIDVFFSALAQDRDELAIGIVLSGVTETAGRRSDSAVFPPARKHRKPQLIAPVPACRIARYGSLAPHQVLAIAAHELVSRCPPLPLQL